MIGTDIYHIDGAHAACYAISDIIQHEYYFMTRHARNIPANTSPFENFGLEVWISFIVIYVGLVSASVLALLAFKTCKGNWKVYDLHWSLPIFLSIIGPEFHDYKGFLKFTVILQVLLASVSSVFYNLYNMDLRAILVSQNFEDKVEGWQQMEFLRTKFYFIFDDLTTGLLYFIKRWALGRWGATIINSKLTFPS